MIKIDNFLARLSSKGRQMFIPNTNQMICYEEPDEIVSRIRQFVQVVQANHP
jgi:hypothetical protein